MKKYKAERRAEHMSDSTFAERLVLSHGLLLSAKHFQNSFGIDGETGRGRSFGLAGSQGYSQGQNEEKKAQGY
jgi:hypothetical protein